MNTVRRDQNNTVGRVQDKYIQCGEFRIITMWSGFRINKVRGFRINTYSGKVQDNNNVVGSG